MLTQSGLKWLVPWKTLPQKQQPMLCATFLQDTAFQSKSLVTAAHHFSLPSTQHSTTRSSPAKLFLQRELRSRLSLVRPVLATHVSNQQEKMKMHDDKYAKFREISVGDTVLAHDCLSGQKWQPGTVVQHPSSHSFQVHLDDGQVWRRLVDDILQNNSHSKTAETGVPSSETATPVVPEPQPVISPEISLHPPDNSAQLETTPASTSPVLRRSFRCHRPPQRLIEEMWIWTLLMNICFCCCCYWLIVS